MNVWCKGDFPLIPVRLFPSPLLGHDREETLLVQLMFDDLCKQWKWSLS